MIAILCNSIGPYHSARYQALNRLTSDVVIIEMTSNEKKYPWKNMGRDSGEMVETLFPGESLEKVPPKKVIAKLEERLDFIKPDVVVSGSYGSKIMRAGTSWAKRNGALSINQTDTWKGGRRRYLPLEIVKGSWCRTHYDAMFVAGSRSRDYYVSLGFPANRFWTGYDVVDNTYFRNMCAIVQHEENATRTRLHLPENYFLCVARLSEEKNLERLIKAYSIYHRNQGQWSLVIVGSGRMEEKLKSLARQTVGEKVVFIGWQNYSNLPLYYALASCFILPSLSETWGLVVNEAMASSLPVLISERCGCLPELCWRGINGYDFDPFNVADLSNQMIKISSSTNLESMSKSSQQIIENFSPDTWARSLLDCINTLYAM